MSSIKDDGNNNNNKKKKKNSLGAPSSPSNSTSNGSTGTVTATQPQPKPAPANKRKRNLPGTPDPRAEVVALSPDSLMATNRFVCEICNKGFQRDQNLQLHRRGHNLPWKLKQRTTGEVRKRVYVCPEPSCVHHHPARALGDLTGIKKHFSRKHGEKNWNCDKCSKKYAVQSDWKAHLKICGTKEYKCECGTIFSRRDSFMTHRAFCEALIEENRLAKNEGLSLNQHMGQVSDLLVGSSSSDQETENPLLPHHQHQQVLLPLPAMPSPKPFIINNNNTTAAPAAGSSIFQSFGYASLSATALLQKAAQMGATANNNGVAIGSNDSNNMMAMMMMMSSPTMHSSMAPPSFGAPPPPPARVDDMSSSQFFGNVNNHQGSSSAMNDMGMFYRFLDQNNAAALMKKLERESTGSNNNETGGGSKNVLHGNMNGMTVDFMGIGGSRTRNNIHDPHQQQQQQSIVGQQQQQPRAIQSFNQFQQQQDVPFFN